MFAWVVAEPKLPVAAYFLYMTEAKANHGRPLDKADVEKLQQNWMNMTKQARSSYTNLESRLTQQHERQVAEYRRHGRYKAGDSVELV